MMHSQSFATAILLVGTATLAVSQTPPSNLIATLRQEGANRFADRLEANPATLNMFLTNTSTIFAPSDRFITARELQERDSPDDSLSFQASKRENRIASDSSDLPGPIYESFLASQKLDNSPQVVVGDTRPANITGPVKRSVQHMVLQRQQPNQTAPQSFMRLSSGLGKTTNIIKADVKFDKGLIQITDSYFTLPQPLSNTSQATGQTAFADLAASGNLTSQLDNLHSVTVFMPSNAALSSTGKMSASAAAHFISNHVVAGFVGYLPALKDGATLKTQTGQTLTIKIIGGRYYVNGALITQANIILDSGVAHVIDKPLTPQPVTGSASAPTRAAGLILSVVGVLFGVAMFPLF